jgi:hypothetical protein
MLDPDWTRERGYSHADKLRLIMEAHDMENNNDPLSLDHDFVEGERMYPLTHDAEHHEKIETETGRSCQNPECLAAENNDPRFWVLDFNASDHSEDLKKSMDNGELTCIVDEKAGGIVAYVIHKALSPEAVVEALEGSEIE